MRIGLVTTSFPRHPDDAAGRFVWEMADTLAATGVAVDVLAPQGACFPPGVQGWCYANPSFGDAPLLLSEGAPEHLERTPVRSGLQGVAAAWDMGRVLRRRGRAWDAAISHWLVPSSLVTAAVLPRVPHVAVGHSGDIHLLQRSRWGAAAARTLARRVDVFAFASRWGNAAFSRLAAPRDARDRLVLPMGIHAANPSNAVRRATRNQLGLDGTIVLFVGRLVPIKGLDVAIQALSGADATLVVLGDGPMRAPWEALCRRAAVPAHFLGQVGPARRDALLAAADLAVVPSRPRPDGRTEGTPTALLQALAAGLPVVASDTGGIREVLQGTQGGWLLPPQDPAAWRTALHRLIADRALRRRMGAAARRCGARYTWEALLPQWREAVDRALHRRKQGE